MLENDAIRKRLFHVLNSRNGCVHCHYIQPPFYKPTSGLIFFNQSRKLLQPLLTAFKLGDWLQNCSAAILDDLSKIFVLLILPSRASTHIITLELLSCKLQFMCTYAAGIDSVFQILNLDLCACQKKHILSFIYRIYLAILHIKFHALDATVYRLHRDLPLLCCLRLKYLHRLLILSQCAGQNAHLLLQTFQFTLILL